MSSVNRRKSNKSNNENVTERQRALLPIGLTITTTVALTVYLYLRYLYKVNGEASLNKQLHALGKQIQHELDHLQSPLTTDSFGIGEEYKPLHKSIADFLTVHQCTITVQIVIINDKKQQQQNNNNCTSFVPCRYCVQTKRYFEEMPLTIVSPEMLKQVNQEKFLTGTSLLLGNQFDNVRPTIAAILTNLSLQQSLVPPASDCKNSFLTRRPENIDNVVTIIRPYHSPYSNKILAYIVICKF